MCSGATTIHAQKSITGVKGRIDLSGLNSGQKGDKSFKLGVHA